MKKIRLLLGNRPRLMREIVRDMIERQEDMEVVGEVLNPVDLLVAVSETAADVVILGLQNSEPPGICSHLLNEYPHIKILGVTADGRRVFLYELTPQKVPIGEVSPQGLLIAIRAAVRGQEG